MLDLTIIGKSTIRVKNHLRFLHLEYNMIRSIDGNFILVDDERRPVKFFELNANNNMLLKTSSLRRIGSVFVANSHKGIIVFDGKKVFEEEVEAKGVVSVDFEGESVYFSV